MNALDIAGRVVGAGQPCFMIAEAGVNHDGDLEVAKRLIDVAVQAGADAVKFQTFRSDRVASLAAPKAAYQRHTTDAVESQLAMLRRLELSPDAYGQLQAYCRQQPILFLSTPSDEESADLLDALGVPAFKIGSGEVTNWPFLAHIARKGRPIMLSTGMSSLVEVDDAVKTIIRAGCRQLALLHCVSNYPADPADVNLRAMRTLAEVFQVPVGYSDHTSGIDIAMGAVALGACIIEKHITLDRRRAGPDHLASLEPDELAALVRGVRRVEAALGHGRKEPAASELNTAAAARRSLVAARPIRAGSELTRDVITVKRPGTGLPPAMLARVVGRRAKQDIPEDTVLTMDMLG